VTCSNLEYRAYDSRGLLICFYKYKALRFSALSVVFEATFDETTYIASKSEWTKDDPMVATS